MVKWIVGNENPTQTEENHGKNPSQVGRHQDLNPGPPKCESRALPRSHLARLFCFIIILMILFHNLVKNPR